MVNLLNTVAAIAGKSVGIIQVHSKYYTENMKDSYKEAKREKEIKEIKKVLSNLKSESN